MWRLSALVTVQFVIWGLVTAGPNPLCDRDDELCTRTKQGVVCGEFALSRDGRKYTAFRGIPYAKPPIGDLRFKDPVPIDNWDTKYSATKDAPICIQKNYLIADPPVEGQEDCLYINVYTPKHIIANKISRHPLPVMVYVHGGGWFSGAGSSTLHGPEYFMDQDVVLVTFNYRLGVFGFLSTQDDAAAGNWALKDMTLALKWIQDNIKYFGGDQDSVTIFGQSAGGASVHFLLLSPETKGLFHKAISQSGSALNLFATTIVEPLTIAKTQASFVGCNPNDTTTEIVECLRKVEPSLLVESGDKFKFWSVDPIVIYNPTVEKKTDKNPHPFLLDKPINLISKGQFHHVPYILGVVPNEGLIRAAPIASQSKLREDLNARWEELATQIFALPYSVKNNLSLLPNLYKNVTDFYFGNETKIDYKDPKSVQNYVDIWSDRGFIYGVYQSAVKHAKLGLQPVYFYKFDYSGRDSWGTVFAGHSDTEVNLKLTKSHCDDLIYLFTIKDFFPEQMEKCSCDYKISKELVKLWTTFAKEGKPAKLWNPVSADKFQYLQITNDTNMEMKTDFLPERMNFWLNQDITENL